MQEAYEQQRDSLSMHPTDLEKIEEHAVFFDNILLHHTYAAGLKKELEQTRLELEQTRLELEQVRLELEQTRLELAQTRLE